MPAALPRAAAPFPNRQRLDRLAGGPVFSWRFPGNSREKFPRSGQPRWSSDPRSIGAAPRRHALWAVSH